MANIHFIRQKEPLGLGHAVLCARDHVGDEPFVVLLGDIIVEQDKPCTAGLIEQHQRRGGSVLALQKMPREKISAYGVIDGERIDDGVFKINDLIEKPEPGTAPSDLAIIGRYLLTPGIFRCIEKTLPDHRGEIQLTDAIKLLGEKEDIFGVEYKGKLWDVGTIPGFIKASIDIGLQRKELRGELLGYIREICTDEGGAD
jgi:UTP--glucose-1-phosphate uridylyltransferase